MEHLYERISYLQGLAEGLGIEENSKEGKLLLHIIDALEDFADAIDDLSFEQEELGEYVEYIDEDLTDVEDEVFGECDYEDDLEDYDEYEFEDDIDYVELECPHCQETLYIEEDLLHEDATCPNCLESIVCCEEEEE
ncbi:CD1247 N-terminal domain-containing protein [Sporosalibacterium faouarense]|uniref:CD1247 N-terminal domain-containing protein n=1 Tax=Sporosalibacterium faouarense TaxID=516123 RepID=UPI00141D6016|nr:CD1247 N-terminal domain-containing protein [Sporosalibacterium faouarense]MTI48205.1 hypothetical protein [Bacillota bacterium]